MRLVKFELEEVLSVQDTLGIKEIKEFLKWLFDSREAVDKAKKDDGEITLRDIPKFGKVILGALTGLVGLEKIPAEFNNLTEEEKKELFDYVKERFSISNKQAEVYIENIMYSCLQIGINLNGLYKLKH